jgi:hypothetical protein
MRDHYANWWSGVAPRVDEPSTITVGNDAENPVQLSPSDWFDAFLDQQRQIRAAAKTNGPWHIEIDRTGDYEITLSRWPLEADLPITSSAPEHRGPDGTYPAGLAVPAIRARLKVDRFDETKPVSATDKAVTFDVALKAGRTQLQTWFYDADEQSPCGAYFVQVRRK